MVSLIMDNADHTPRVEAFMAGIAERIGDSVAQRERASLTQLAYDLLDPAPPIAQPEPRLITVLIIDLRGFSVLADSCDPPLLLAILKPFFERMTSLVHEHGGFVDKFLGDGVMALFGAPQTHEDHLQRALACAARMQQAMLNLNAGNIARGMPEIHAGIGINTGEVMVGSFGPRQHSEYTAIGDEVNFASRVESFSLRGQVLLSENSYRAARDWIETGAIRQLRVKGRSGPVTLYEMTAVTAPRELIVPRVEMRASPRVPVQLPLRFYRVQDKQIMDQPYRGSITNLGYDGMLTRLPLDLPSLSEISFTVTPDLTADESSDLYARALHSSRDDNVYQTAFAFTTAGTPGHEAVRRYVDRLLWGAGG
ncbi:MAG: adenylate/guanylate cyclase domain-containing protein [Chromatocurvus sp.]